MKLWLFHILIIISLTSCVIRRFNNIINIEVLFLNQNMKYTSDLPLKFYIEYDPNINSNLEQTIKLCMEITPDLENFLLFSRIASEMDFSEPSKILIENDQNPTTSKELCLYIKSHLCDGYLSKFFYSNEQADTLITFEKPVEQHLLKFISLSRESFLGDEMVFKNLKYLLKTNVLVNISLLDVKEIYFCCLLTYEFKVDYPGGNMSNKKLKKNAIAVFNEKKNLIEAHFQEHRYFYYEVVEKILKYKPKVKKLGDNNDKINDILSRIEILLYTNLEQKIQQNIIKTIKDGWGWYGELLKEEERIHRYFLKPLFALFINKYVSTDETDYFRIYFVVRDWDTSFIKKLRLRDPTISLKDDKIFNNIKKHLIFKELYEEEIGEYIYTSLYRPLKDLIKIIYQ
jgi:hypothetical protein